MAFARQPATGQAVVWLNATLALGAALTFAYIGAQRLGNGQLVPQRLTDAGLVKPGIFALGVPAIILAVILRVGRTWRQRAEAAPPAHL